MSEKMPTPESKKETPQERDARGRLQYEAHPIAETVQDSSEVYKEKIQEFETLLANLEQGFDLEALRAITHFDSVEDRTNSPRQAAMEALPPLISLLNYLRDQENISRDVYESLKEKYRIIRNAIGHVTAGKDGVFENVDHNR